MPAGINITGDVNTDVEARRILRLRIDGPRPEEGDFCGLLFAGEKGSEGYVPVSITVIGAENAAELDLGGSGYDYTGGAVILDEDTTVNVAIDRINKALGVFDPDVDSFEVALGGDVTDWPALTGAVLLTPDLSVHEALVLLNEKLLDVSQQEPPASDGFHLILGDVAVDGDGSWAAGAVMLTDTMPISEGIDRLNEVLGKLVPGAPPNFPNGVLSLTNTAGASPRLALGYTYNDGDVFTAGTAVIRVAATSINSNVLNDVGPGDSGTLYALLNGTNAPARTLTGSDDGNYGGLQISDQKDFPVLTPGFWKSIDVSFSGLPVPVGLNSVLIGHTGAGETNTIFFMRDPMTASPAISAGSVAEAPGGPGTLAYSSGVPHYGTDGFLVVAMSIANLAGETYYGGGDPIQFTGPVIGTKTISYDTADIDAPIARNTLAPVAILAQTISVDGNGHNSGKISGVARNVNGSASLDLGGPTILIKRGAAGARIDENAISGPGVTAVRKGTPPGDKPATAAAWASSAALAVHEAAVVAGVAVHDQTNYAAGFLPVGPNLSAGRAGAQYLTLSFNKTAMSGFKIVLAGSYAAVFVKLPGVTDNAGIAPNAVNGWMDATKAYDGAGVPGKAGDTLAGCALGTPMGGAGGTYQITFGTQSSTNSTANEVLIHIRLNAGQSITALSFTA